MLYLQDRRSKVRYDDTRSKCQGVGLQSSSANRLLYLRGKPLLYSCLSFTDAFAVSRARDAGLMMPPKVLASVLVH
jgi:hypothetical protein